MDRHTLIVIIVTVAVTTTVTTVVGWILNFFKLRIATTLITKARTSVGKTLLKISLYVFILTLNAWDLSRHLNAPGYPTRSEVVLIFLLLVGIGVWFSAIVSEVIGIYFQNKMARAKANSSN